MKQSATQTLSRWARLLLLGYWVALAIATHWPELIVTGVGEAGSDKLGHLACFGVLAVLLTYAIAGPKRPPGHLHILYGTLITAVYGILDEWTQGMVPGRHFTLLDGAANVIGALLAGLFMARVAVGRWWSVWGRWVVRVLLLAILVILAIGGFLPKFNWNLLVKQEWLVALGWSDPSRFFPFDAVAHVSGPLLLTLLLPPARLLGSRYLAIKNTMLVLIVLLSAPVIELIQYRYLGRTFQLTDMRYHLLGMGGGLAVWALIVAAKRPAPQQEEDENAFVGHALLVSLLTIGSRVTGLMRDSVLAAIFGLSGIYSAFAIGFMIPNLFRRLFGEGALAAAFIPAYAKDQRRDPPAATRLASLCVALLALFTGLLVVVGEGLLIFCRDFFVWTEQSKLVIQLAMVMLPYMPLVCLVALLGGILQVHRHFGPPATASILLNLTMILAAVLALAHPGATTTDQHRTILVIAGSVIVAGFFQVLWQVIAVRRVESFSFDLKPAVPAVRGILKMMLPMVIGLAAVQINTLLDMLIAWSLAPADGPSAADHLNLFGRKVDFPIANRGAPGTLSLAQRLYQLPLGVFGIAVATAIFPALARASSSSEAGDSRRAEFRTILQRGLRLTMFVGLPASIGLMLVGLPLVRVLFEHGEKMQLDDSKRITTVLIGYASAVWAYSTTHLIVRAFYAVKDVHTPLRVSVAMVILNLVLNLILVWKLAEAALAWSTALTAVIQTAVLVVAVRRYVFRPVDRSVLVSWGRSAVLTALMAIILWAILRWRDPAQLSRLDCGGLLTGLVVIGMGVYLFGARLLGAEELEWLRRGKSVKPKERTP